jgi:hypothetical protein
MFTDKPSQADRLQGEIWRILLFGMLLFLLAEGWLILPAALAPAVKGLQTNRPISRPVRVPDPVA